MKQKKADSKQPQQVASAQQPHMKSRKRRRGSASLQGLPKEEQQRRLRQIELQQQARAAQAAGVKYKKSRTSTSTTSAEKKPTTTHAPKPHVQVIIIPIYWKKREEEANSVLSAAGAVLQLLRKHTITASIDSSETRTPGQKYRLWEERGIKVRVEIGPKDAQSQRCVLAVAADSPGQLASKQAYQVGALVSQVQQALGLQPTTEDDVEHLENEVSKEPHVASLTPSTKAKKPAAFSIQAKDAIKDPASAKATRAKNKAHTAPQLQLASGDDLGGDFAGVDLFEEVVDEDPRKRRKKDKKNTIRSDMLMPGTALGKARRPTQVPKIVTF